MKQLRGIRILLAILFFIASAAYLFIGAHSHAMASLSVKMQILPSAISVSIGTIIFWLIATTMLGRIYCSTVCPIGTLQDIFVKLRRKSPRLNHPYSFRGKNRWTFHFIIVYLIALLTGIMALPFVTEPWNIMRNIAAGINPDAVGSTWITLGLGSGIGFLIGILSFITLAVSAIWKGRIFCTDVCPIGSMLGMLDNQTLFHIEIDPDKCISCLHCENICRSSCIKVVSRYVDNSRCVRCFDCVAECPADAIRYQLNRNRRPASPLMKKVNQKSS